MARFWHTEPIEKLMQRRGSLPFGLYPSVSYSHSSDKWSAKKPYNYDRMHEMLNWAATNCKHQFTFSEKYGSFYFADEQDRAMFRLFHSDDTMPEPEVEI